MHVRIDQTRQNCCLAEIADLSMSGDLVSRNGRTNLLPFHEHSRRTDALWRYYPLRDKGLHGYGPGIILNLQLMGQPIVRGSLFQLSAIEKSSLEKFREFRSTAYTCSLMKRLHRHFAD